MKISAPVLVTSFLAAIVGANILIATLGPSWLWLTAFLLIPFDLVSRDLLHDLWRGKNLKMRMGALIVSGSLLSYLFNPESRSVALASCVSFFISESINTLLYQAFIDKTRLFKMNIANLAASIADSCVFPYVAFSILDPFFSLRQASIKLLGGLIWALLFKDFNLNKDTE